MSKRKLEAEIAADPGFGAYLKHSGVYPKAGMKAAKKSKKKESEE